jgi:hypothetical protein
MEFYDASNGWTIHRDSAYFVLDKRNPHAESDLNAIVVACDEGIANGCGKWIEILKCEATAFLID